MSKRILGIEFGSTRIKSVLVDENAKVLAVGGYEWENDYVDGHFTYPMEKVFEGLAESYSSLVENYKEPITKLDCIGVSGMMHGYLPFDEEYNLLVPFRTWRDTTTSMAQDILTEKLQFNMPQRWSATHYYQAVLRGEKHVEKVAHLCTLSSYVHFLLSGENVVGANDGSGMFPLLGNNYDKEKAKIYNELLKERGVDKDILQLLPNILLAGEKGGYLTEEGARLLDKTGTLQAGALMCPPEGDMGTGMVCTNAIDVLEGNVSLGTSSNLTVVLEKPLSKPYKEVDVIATPDGNVGVIIHTNNGTTEINAWVSLFEEVISLFSNNVPSRKEMFDMLYKKSLESDDKVGNIVNYNYLGGEPLAKTTKGVPMVLREADSNFTLANFMQAQLYGVVSTLALGLDILRNENVEIKSMTGHGGYYKAEFVGQNITSCLTKSPVTVMEQASEGGAWGIAVLALYTLNPVGSLKEMLENVFKDVKKTTLTASKEDMDKFDRYMNQFRRFLVAEKEASKA